MTPRAIARRHGQRRCSGSRALPRSRARSSYDVGFAPRHGGNQSVRKADRPSFEWSTMRSRQRAACKSTALSASLSLPVRVRGVCVVLPTRCRQQWCLGPPSRHGAGTGALGPMCINSLHWADRKPFSRPADLMNCCHQRDGQRRSTRSPRSPRSPRSGPCPQTKVIGI